MEREVFGIKFRSPVGLAAGFDKDAELIDVLDNLGFGFIEIGTITPKAQPGNPKPRLFRLKRDKALINRMGFNNEGVQKAVERLKSRQSNIVVGGNIGKNKKIYIKIEKDSNHPDVKEIWRILPTSIKLKYPDGFVRNAL